MKKIKSKGKFLLPILLALLAILSYVYSQFFAVSDKIFITDDLFITPKTQPFIYVFFIFACVGLLLFGLYLGLWLISFLFHKGIAFQAVGILLLFVAIGLSVLLFIGHEVDGIEDYIIGGVLILFLGILGILMTFANKIGKRKRK